MVCIHREGNVNRECPPRLSKIVLNMLEIKLLTCKLASSVIYYTVVLRLCWGPISVMLKIFTVIALLAGCSVANFGAPKALDDACSILKQKPQWKSSMRAVERRWKVPTSVQMAIIWQESKFERWARTPMKTWFGIVPVGRVSSAFGYAQVLDGTWEWYKKSTGKRRAKRTNFKDASDFIGWYIDITAKKFGVPKNDVRNQYLAYHEGHSGFARQSYQSKRWLVKVADRLVERQKMYSRQLSGC